MAARPIEERPEGVGTLAATADPPPYMKGSSKMDVETILQMIGSVGFPIVACGALFYQMNKENEMHREEMNAFKDTINELRTAIVELTVRLTKDNKND